MDDLGRLVLLGAVMEAAKWLLIAYVAVTVARILRGKD